MPLGDHFFLEIKFLLAIIGEGRPGNIPVTIDEN